MERCHGKKQPLFGRKLIRAVVDAPGDGVVAVGVAPRAVQRAVPAAGKGIEIGVREAARVAVDAPRRARPRLREAQHPFRAAGDAVVVHHRATARVHEAAARLSFLL